MDNEASEEEQLRSVALDNARAILRARQRAERDLIAANEALDKKTQELARSLGLLRATLEATSDGILVIDCDGIITGCNEKFNTMWKIPRDIDVRGEPERLTELCMQQVAAPHGYLSRIEQINRSSVVESTDTLDFTDGRIFERFSTVQYLDGQNVGRVWSFRDVTAQKRAERELREQREWFEVTLDSIGDSVITTDMDGKVTFLNPVAEKMTGWTSAEAFGKALERVFNVVNEITGQAVENPVGMVLRTGAVVELANHTALVAKDGTQIAIEDSAAPIRNLDGDISGVVMVFHDVTKRRRAEAALRDADRRKDEFLATLAHELRNPLAPIRQAALISKADGATAAQKRWSNDVIERQVRHMALLLDDLLDLSRITRGTLALRTQPTDLASLIDAAIETARPIIDAKRHRLSIDIRDKHERFDADPLRMAQVLSNLLTNAAKYTDPEGHIQITARCVTQDICIEVTDSGIGISAENLQTIFEMFTQVQSTHARSEGGLGIGLALTKGLVELHGGILEAKSDGLGRGSKFTVRIPKRISVVMPIDRSKASDSAKARRVLIADDNRDAADSLATLLQLDGHQVTVVHDGSGAMAAFTETRPHLVLLDIGMPGLNGYDVAARIRQSYPASGTTLIAITGWGQEEDRARAVAAGFDHHLTKPVDFERLSHLIK